MIVAFTNQVSGEPGPAHGDMAVSYDWPRWASVGYSMGRTEITAEKHVTERNIDEETFRDAVDLAEAMPDFSEQESSRESIVLHRAFLGGAAASSAAGFLDFALRWRARCWGERTKAS